MLLRYKEIDYAIDILEGKEPLYGPIYPLSRRELKELRRFLDKNLANKRIRYSKSLANSLILFIPKRDGSLRLYIDYKGLNKITVKNRYLLPLISEILDRASGTKYFTKINI